MLCFIVRKCTLFYIMLYVCYVMLCTIFYELFAGVYVILRCVMLYIYDVRMHAFTNK